MISYFGVKDFLLLEKTGFRLEFETKDSSKRGLRRSDLIIPDLKSPFYSKCALIKSEAPTECQEVSQPHLMFSYFQAPLS